MSDGTFGTTADLEPLEPEIVEAVENHRFDPLERLYWRNSRLRFDSLGGLIRSLDERPTTLGLVQAREADDQIALQALAKLPDVAAAARHPAGDPPAVGSLPDPRFPQGDERHSTPSSSRRSTAISAVPRRSCRSIGWQSR